MIGELTRKEAVIGGTALFFTSDRVSEIDYIAMTTPTKSKFVFRQPKLSYVTNVYALPFHWSVWASTFAFVAISAVVLYFVIRWEWAKKNFENDQVNNFEYFYLVCNFLLIPFAMNTLRAIKLSRFNNHSVVAAVVRVSVKQCYHQVHLVVN